MIEDPPLLTVRRRFARPTPAQVAAFAGLPTGFVIDAMNGRGALDGAVKPVGGSAAFCGVAVTAECGPSDNLACFGALQVVQKGDVVMCASDSFRGTAVIGDLLAGMFRNAGAVAFVTDGFVRDIPGIRAVGLPCYAAGVTPNSPVRNGPGTVGFPTVIGGTPVASGDVVIGDEDGVIVVPLARLDEVIARLPLVRKAEADLEAKVKAGLIMPEFIDTSRFKTVD